MESCSPEKNMLCSDRKNNYTKEEHIDTCCTETKYMTLYQKKLQSIERIYFSELNKPNNINCLEYGKKYLELMLHKFLIGIK